MSKLLQLPPLPPLPKWLRLLLLLLPLLLRLLLSPLPPLLKSLPLLRTDRFQRIGKAALWSGFFHGRNFWCKPFRELITANEAKPRTSLPQTRQALLAGTR